MQIKSIFKDLPTLETERLILRKVKKQDVNAIFEFASDPEVSRFMTWDYHRTIADSMDFVKFALRKYKEHDVAPWGIELKAHPKIPSQREGGKAGQIIGTAGFAYWQPKHRRAEIGYSLGRDYWNQGLMTEAVIEIIRFGFERMELNRLEARCRTDNAASEKVMLKCGMRFEGVLRQQMFVKGEFEDFKMYSILKEEWNSQRTTNKSEIRSPKF